MKTFMTTLLLVLAFIVQAEVKMPAIFSDNMVLQSGTKVPVWGWAAAGEKVSVTFAGQTKTATADQAGKWQVELDSLKPGLKGEMKIQGKNAITIKNVLTGEVWFCSGQSNMAYGVNGLKEQAEVKARPEEPGIRIFKVAQRGPAEPGKDVIGKWQICNGKSLHGTSAVGYYFAYDLHKEKKVPVGIIISAFGGSLIQAWTPLKALEKDPKMQQYVKTFQASKPHVLSETEFQKASKAYWGDFHRMKKLNQEYKKETGKNIPQDKKAEKFKEKFGRLPTPQMKARRSNTPTLLYNGMVAGVQPFAIRGVLWYQGESNGWMGPIYADQMVTMINSWRDGWNNKTLPFLFVQLPGYQKKATQPQQSPWSILREAQSKANKKVPHTGMACTIDLGEEHDIHPKNKKSVAERLYKIAKAKVYGAKDLVYSGPVMKEVKFKDGKAIVTFDHVHGGLVDQNGGELKGFAVSGKGKKFQWAKAKIVGDTVEVWNDQIKEPVSIRYAWSMYPDFDLYNKDGLPAHPFRTDDWPR